MKKLIVAFCVLGVFIACLFLLPKYDATAPASKFFKAKNLDLQLVEDFLKNPDDPSSKNIIILTTLQNLNLKSWAKSTALNSHIISGDILGGEENELIIAFSLGKDSGCLAVYSRTPEGYKLSASLLNLAPITKLSLLKIPTLPKQVIEVEEYLNEMFGAFYKVRSLAFFMIDNNKLKKIWQRDTMREEYYPESFELKGEKTQWLMKKEEAKIKITPQGNIIVSGNVLYGKNKVLGELNGDYTITSQEEITEEYVWNKGKKLYKRTLVLDF